MEINVVNMRKMYQYDDAYMYQATPGQHLELNSEFTESELKNNVAYIKSV